MKMCPECKSHYLFGNDEICVSCKNGIKPHDCEKDGHEPKFGLCMWHCIHCGAAGEIAPELQPSEIEAAYIGGWNGQRGEEDD